MLFQDSTTLKGAHQSTESLTKVKNPRLTKDSNLFPQSPTLVDKRSQALLYPGFKCHEFSNVLCIKSEGMLIEMTFQTLCVNKTLS